MRRIFLVGEDYGNSEFRYHHDRYCLTGKSGETLAEMMGVDFTRYVRLTKRMNVVDLPEDWSDRVLVQAGVARIKANIDPTQSVILLGSKVASAFGLDDLGLFEWRGWPHSVRVARVPHPSGRNRVLNDPRVRLDFRTFLEASVA